MPKIKSAVMRWSKSKSSLTAALLFLATIMATTMRLMGRVWWCEGGDWTPWSWDVWSRHNSQHLMDPYSLSHVQHGIGLCALLLLIFPNRTTAAIRTGMV